MLDGEMSRDELQEALGLSHRGHFYTEYLNPAINDEVVELTIPDKPKSSKQKYRLTHKGLKVKGKDL